MTDTLATGFADFVRRLRLEAGLSQEALAERAGISVKAVSAYERGIRFAPRRETLAALVAALELRGERRAEFERAAARRETAASPTGHNLPWQATTFIGRLGCIDEITTLLRERRMVTITGAGGIGKTRTALEVVSRREEMPRDGTWFVDLSPVNDADVVVSKIASALGLQLARSDDLTRALVEAIGRRELLVVLDNCEHLIAAARAVADAMLQGCPHVRILATSRERLRVAGEHVYQLATLRIPDEAVALFVDRARMLKHDFHLTAEQSALAADICRRLDGNALAIELAAARLPTLGIAQLHTQLREHFRIIAGADDRPERHRTLLAAISWSHDLLAEPERTLLRRLSVFAHGWTIESASRVCCDESFDRAALFDALTSLVEKSLVLVDLDGEMPRYAFYESTRAFAAERLTASGERATLSRLHAQWVADFAHRMGEMYHTVARWRWEIAVAAEADNVLAALEWAFSPGGDIELGAEITSALHGCWLIPGLGVHGKRYFGLALERLDAAAQPELLARVLVGQASQLLYGRACVDAMRHAIDLLRDSTDLRTLGRCYVTLAHALAQIEENAEAERASNHALTLLQQAKLQRSSLYTRLQSDRSRMFRSQARFAEAKAALNQALALATDLEDTWSVSLCQMILAEIEFVAGDPARAVTLGEEACASARRAGQEVYARCNLACYQLAVGDTDAAQVNAREVVRAAAGVDENATQGALQHLAVVAARRDRPHAAARLLGYVDAWYARIGSPRDATDQKGLDMLLDALGTTLSDEEVVACVAQGARFTEEDAIREAGC